MVTVKEILDIIEGFCPTEAAADWDNVGLQIGREDAEVTSILVTLDVTEEVIKEASEKGANLVVAHHPVTRGEIKSINSHDFSGSRLWSAARADVHVLVAHTNLDACPGGVSDILAEKLGLVDVEVLVQTKGRSQYKLVCFVPLSHIEQVSNAICVAGGGVIGDYTHCTFRALGKGTYKPGPRSNPAIGTSGKINEVEEVRLESVVSGQNLRSVLTTMLAVHPYEEVAYDVYRLEDLRPSFGWGRIGNLKTSVKLKECVKMCVDRLELNDVRVCGNLSKEVERVAVCGGSGGDLVKAAKDKGAQVFVTGDVKYHDAQLADFLGLAVVDAGHYFTERIVLPKLVSFLEKALRKRQKTIKVAASEIDTNPWVTNNSWE